MWSQALLPGMHTLFTGHGSPTLSHFTQDGCGHMGVASLAVHWTILTSQAPQKHCTRGVTIQHGERGRGGEGERGRGGEGEKGRRGEGEAERERV